MRFSIQIKSRKRPIFLSFLTAIFLLSFSTAQVFAQGLTLPSDFGKIQETREGTNGKTIILIQEAHVDLEAQKSMIKILKSLMLQTGVRQFLVEGGWGNVSLSEMRVYGTLDGRRKIADHFLEAGKISAEEYLDILGEFPMELWGIEDRALYSQNMKAFLHFHEAQTSALEANSRMLQSVRELADKALNKKLRNWDLRRRAFHDEKISLSVYLPELVNTAQVSFKDYPEMDHISALMGKSSDFDLDKLEKEKRELRAALSKRVSKVELEPIRGLMENKQPEKEHELLLQMFEIVERYPDIQKKYPSPNLRAYEKILGQTQSMDLGKLFSDIRLLENKAIERLTKNEDEEKILKLERLLESIQQLFELRMGPEDYRELSSSLAQPSKGNVLTDLVFALKPLAAQNKISWSFETLMSTVTKNIPAASDFYESALKREEALIRNTSESMIKSKEEAAVVITGGFHATRMARVLNEKGFTVLTVSPRFEPKDASMSQEKYFRVLKDKWMSVKDESLKSQTTNPNIQIPNSKQITNLKSQTPKGTQMAFGGKS